VEHENPHLPPSDNDRMRWYQRPRWWVIGMSAVLAMAIMGSVVPRYLLVQRAARDVSDLGGRLTITRQSFAVLDQLTGWGDNVAVELTDVPATDQDIERLTGCLAQLGNVRFLDLSGTQVSDACLPSIARLTGLSSLHLARTRISGRGFEHLESLTSLEDVNLDGSVVDDSGLVKLARVPGLTAINIDNTSVSDTGVAHLSRLPGLETLSAANTGLTESGASQLVERHPDLAIFDD